MTFDNRASGRVTDVAGRLATANATPFLRQFITKMWSANSGRFEKSLGDTARSLGVQCSENIATKIWEAREDPALKDVNLEVQRLHGATFLTFDEVSIRFVKAPASSGLNPDWGTDFEWESNVRQEAAFRNDKAYRAPVQEVGHEDLFPVTGLGEPDDLNDFFLVWNGQLDDVPLTAGWLAVPSLRPEHVIAAAEIWRDTPQGDGTVMRREGPIAPETPAEPDLNIRLKKKIQDVRSGS